MYEEDEDIPAEEEVEFEETALRLQQKLEKLSAKFQQIFLQESMLPHRTSEICQIQQLMIDDLRQEITDLRNVETQNQQNPIENEKCIKMMDEKSLKNEIDDSILNKFVDIVDSVGVDVVEKSENSLKTEIKTETSHWDNDHSNNKQTFQHIKQQQQEHLLNNKFNQIHDSRNINEIKSDVKDVKQQQATTLLPPTQQQQQPLTNSEIKMNNNADNVKNEFEQFDIETEITPSFIMKKVENKTEITTATTTNKETPNSTLSTVATMSREKSFNDVYLQSSNVTTTKYQKQSQQQQQQQQQTMEVKKQQEQQLPTQQYEQQQQQSDDEWLCIQNELNFINDNKIQQNNKQTNSLYAPVVAPTITTTTTANELNTTNHINDHLFVNGCLENEHKQQQQQEQELEKQTDFARQQYSVNGSGIVEFFDSTDDDEVQRSVETRLEAMFGESPVPLSGKHDSDSQDIESGLEEIFGNSKSPIGSTGVNIIDAIKNKRLWEEEMATQKTFYNNTNAQQQYVTQTQQQQQQQQHQQTHHIQLNCNNNPRWMQNMEAQFSNDFNGSNINMNGVDVGVINEELISRKRSWTNHNLLSGNDFIGDEPADNDVQPLSKKLCHNGNTNLSGDGGGSSSMSSSSSSPLSQQQQNALTHQQEMLDAELLLHEGIGVVETNMNDDYNQMQRQQQQQQHQQTDQTQHFNSQQEQYNNMLLNNMNMNTLQQQQQPNLNQATTAHFVNNDHVHSQQLMQQQQQQSLVNNNSNNNVEFDDVISRHVQNAIDSILNLQNSESDSLPFSLDHSMGSLLGDSILDDRQSTTSIVATTNIANCQTQAQEVLIGGGNNVSNNIINKRQRLNLVDDLSDCLISGASQCGDNASSILLNHNQYQQQQQQQQQTMQNMLNHQHNMNHHHHHQLQQQQQFHQQNAHVPQGMLHLQQQNAAITTTQPTVNHHHQQQQQQQQQQQLQAQQSQPAEVLNDFSCMVANIDEAVKSIMSS